MKLLPLAMLLSAPLLAQQVKIQVEEPVQATGFNNFEPMVLDKSMKWWKCPADANLYIRIDGQKPPDKSFHYVGPEAKIMPRNDGTTYQVFCFKEIAR